ncbi:hypothetical protein [Novipirellula rosea]|uniref:hypothetical protein n=1 Tax=Novipirellula rosea TaxID=1031540 RepID=UPI0031F137A4
MAAHWPLRWAVIQVDSLAAKWVAESMWLQNRMRQPADVDTHVSAAITKIFWGWFKFSPSRRTVFCNAECHSSLCRFAALPLCRFAAVPLCRCAAVRLVL